jgi:transcriptional regulator with XRE-family HTH domain
MNTGPYIARARRILCIGQAELGRRLGVTQEHVCRLEAGAKGPSPELLARLALILERRLVRNLVHRAKAARRENGGDVARLSEEEFVRELRREAQPLMRLLAHATVAGEAVAMEKAAWCALLGTTPRVLRGLRASAVKDGVAVYPAADVGLALEAIVRGRSYREFVAGRSPTEPPFLKDVWSALGMDRLGAELELRAAALDFYFSAGVTGTELVAYRDRLQGEIEADK